MFLPQTSCIIKRVVLEGVSMSIEKFQQRHFVQNGMYADITALCDACCMFDTIAKPNRP